MTEEEKSKELDVLLERVDELANQLAQESDSATTNLQVSVDKLNDKIDHLMKWNIIMKYFASSVLPIIITIILALVGTAWHYGSNLNDKVSGIDKRLHHLQGHFDSYTKEVTKLHNEKFVTHKDLSEFKDNLLEFLVNIFKLYLRDVLNQKL
jgi:hypothetical protein